MSIGSKSYFSFARIILCKIMMSMHMRTGGSKGEVMLAINDHLDATASSFVIS
jgi:hypothetical protein